MKNDNDALLAFAVATARAASEIMRAYFLASDQQVKIKADGTQVTVADKNINTLLIARVREAYPAHGVLGEEEQWQPERNELWVCDPIDGTSAYILGVPTAMFALAYVVNGVPQVAVTYDPFMDRMITAIRGRGAYLNGSKIVVSGQTQLQSSTIGAVSNVAVLLRAKKLYDDLMNKKSVKLKAVHGAIFQGMLVATGKEDGYLFPGRSPHDVATTKLIVEEAGGRVTDLRGHEQLYNAGIYGAIVSNGHIHDELVAAMQQYGPENFVGPSR